MGRGAAGAGEVGAPSRGAFLKKRYVPLGAGDDRRELAAKVAVELDVRGAALGPAGDAGANGAERRIGGEVAAVEEVPGEDSQGPMMPRLTRHLLTGEELTSAELAALLERALELKATRRSAEAPRPLAGRSIALLFERPSTRTRVSFEVGVGELGANPIVLRSDELQLSRGESPGDTARVLGRYVDALVVRSGDHQAVAELAAADVVPVINGLTPLHHPCQALADLVTLRERFGGLDGLALAYVGDGNNVARSLCLLGRAAGVEVRVASPDRYRLEPGLAALDTADPREAAAGADAVYTDVWVSMGDEADAAERRAALAPYQLDAELLAAAADHAIALHCLPAHPGEEITTDVLYGERSAVGDQAENRLHAQKALLELLVG